MASNTSVTIKRLNKDASIESPIKEIEAISSKSFIHRALICASLAHGRSTISYKGLSEDIMATISSLEVMGAKIYIEEDWMTVEAIPADNRSHSIGSKGNHDHISSDGKYGEKIVDCRESGSTLRMLLPLATSLSDDYIFTGRHGLMTRPIDDLTQALRKAGFSISSDSLPIKIRNRIGRKRDIEPKKISDFQIRGDISSQYISGLLLAGPLMDGKLRVDVLDKLESKPYIDLTKDVMSLFGVEVEEDDSRGDLTEGDINRIIKTYSIKPGQAYKSNKIKAESDWSNAGFFLAIGALFRGIRVLNLDLESSQGDKRILEVLKEYGARLVVKESYIEVLPGKRKAMNLDIADTPDMLPILAVLAVFAEGESYFTGIERLRIKESDRIESVISMVECLGACACLKGKNLIISGRDRKKLPVYRVNSFNDHRIVMASSIAASLLDGQLIIEGAEAVNKSYPTFFDDFKVLGFEVR
ncbi:3-phosphoshikimate 1-carboxyvinyltransferase [Peptostreptococcus stomatis]